jgi:S-adenosylmethionine-diacylglycerol 3-amino-3-carboxypropyl transferase
MSSEIAAKASFESIRYAQLWEDADVLITALDTGARHAPRATLVSICSAGDNALAMLMLDPERVVVLDLSQAQIECLNLRIGAYRNLEHSEFLQLMGSRASDQRAELMAKALRSASDATRDFWLARQDDVIAYGAGGCGKFERYFRLFKNRILPFVHSRATVDAIFQPREPHAREEFLEKRWNSWRWKLMMSLFFSRFAMGRLGRDKAFFDHVDGSVAAHVQRRLHHAAVTCDPTENPYLYWIMYAGHGEHLPMAWRAENYEVIRDRLGRLDIRHGALEAFVSTGETADGFNLSDIFEYMSPEVFEAVYGDILKASNPGARLVYWNMMAPRRVPPAHAHRIATQGDVEAAGKAADKAFFYSDFVVEDVLP